jgi:hypothetical protein
MSLRQFTPRTPFDPIRVVVSVYGIVALLLVGVALYALVTRTVVGAILGSVVTITPAFATATVMGLLLVATVFAVRRLEPSTGR